MKPPVALWEVMHKLLLPMFPNFCPRGWDKASYSSSFICNNNQKKSHIRNMWLRVGSRCPHLCLQSYGSAMSLNPAGVPRRAASPPRKDAPTHEAPNLSTFLAGCCCRMAAIRSHKAGSERCCVHRHKTRARPSFPWGSGVSQPLFVCGYGSVSICPGYSASKQISSA